MESLLNSLKNIKANHNNEDDEIQQKEGNYEEWKKNSPLLYNVLIQKNLEWPSMTVQWLPKVEPLIKNNFIFNKQSLLVGTHTSDQEANKLILLSVVTPELSLETNKQVTTPEYFTTFKQLNKVEVIKEFNHEGDVNKARINPFNSDMVVTKSSDSNLYLYNLSNKINYSNNLGNETLSYTSKLVGHSEEGYGLSWSSLKSNYLLSGSNDHTICLYDLTEPKKSISPITKFSSHTNVVSDVSFSRHNENIFASVSDDRTLRL